MIRFLLLLLAIVGVITLAACQAAFLAGAMSQSFEYQKRIEVLPQYEGLEHHSVAVIVDADLDILYQYPRLTESVSVGVGNLLNREVSGIQVMSPVYIREWQFSTPRWNSLPFSDMIKQLNVDRIVLIDIHTFRLNPPGNRWIWDGEATATIGIIEREGLDANEFTDAYSISSRFPVLKELDRDSATQEAIQTGLLADFIKHTAWIFYPHLEPKYPDKYKPELEDPSW
ncbi:MAG: hypothetical protein P8L37_04650 [Phycisphaerales bacterium]|nr:hypothetical protein [Phycisphaerales bacterium]